MTIGIERVTIIGVGLLGASLGLALKTRALVQHVTGVGRRRESLDIALARGAIDDATLDVATGVAGADVVIIATPAGLVVPMLDAALDAAPAHAALLDVASTKKEICEYARSRCPRPRRFVGCHPMVGGEKFGPVHGDPDFFVDAVCLVEQDVAIDTEARETVCALWRGIGARVVDVDVAEHDAMLARTSHAPHVAAAAIARLAAEFGANSNFVGKGFRDITRVAASRPEIWRDICVENRLALGEALAHLCEHIASVREMLAANDPSGIEAFFEAGVEARRRTLES